MGGREALDFMEGGENVDVEVLVWGGCPRAQRIGSGNCRRREGRGIGDFGNADLLFQRVRWLSFRRRTIFASGSLFAIPQPLFTLLRRAKASIKFHPIGRLARAPKITRRRFPIIFKPASIPDQRHLA